MRRRTFLELCGATGAVVGAASLVGARAPAPTLRAGKRLVVVFATGGWDTSYALDPKTPDMVDVPAGAVRRFAGLDVLVDPSRPGVTAFFERHADRTAIVRGVCTDAINHNECQRRIATGTREETRADLGAIVAHDLGNALPLPYLVLGDTAFTGPYAASAGRVGTSNQIVTLLEPDRDGPRDHRGDVVTTAEAALLERYAAASADRARATRGAIGYNRRRVDELASAVERAARLRTLRAGFGAVGDALAFDRQIALAVDALAHDVSHAVMLSTRDPWDTHAGNAQQGPFLDHTFAGLAALVDELARRPGRAAGTRMIDDTVVVAISEMSRTPRLNARAGKDHWPVTSALVVGAGVRGGRVFGATTPDCLAVTIDPTTGAPQPGGVRPLYTNFVAGVLALCGVDPEEHLPGAVVLDAFAA